MKRPVEQVFGLWSGTYTGPAKAHGVSLTQMSLLNKHHCLGPRSGNRKLVLVRVQGNIHEGEAKQVGKGGRLCLPPSWGNCPTPSIWVLLKDHCISHHADGPRNPPIMNPTKLLKDNLAGRKTGLKGVMHQNNIDLLLKVTLLMLQWE